MKTLTVNWKTVLSIVTAMLLIYGIQGTGNVQAQDNGAELTPVSDRTQQVQDRIVALVPGVDSANDVTAAHLALITNLNLSDQSIAALKAGDFDGLSALRSLSLAKNTLSSLPADIFSGLSPMSILDLGSNEISSLPEGVFSELSAMSRLNLSYNSLESLSANTFSGLSSLTGLDLGNNQLSSLPADSFSGLSSLNWLSLSSNQLSSLPDGLFSRLSSLNSLYLGDNTVGLSITASLEKVGGNQFKATAPTGAPFNIVLPITVANGNIDDGATTVTIPAGSVQSELLTVIPTPGTSDAVTVNIGTLPELPTSHYGYSLGKPSAADNTLSFALGIPKPTKDPNVNHAPIFREGSSTTRSIPENTSAGTDIGSPVSATDADEDTLTYTLSGADAASFGIVSTTGQLQTHAPLDYEKKNTYAVTVSVSDGSAIDTISVTIDVTDVEENNAPVFVEGNGTERAIAENTPAGRNIGSPVSATDEDEDTLTYTLSGADAASFGIVSTTGQLRTRAPLDYEKKNTYSVTVTVSDGEGGTDTIGVAINVTDVEENNAPVFVEGTATERSVQENTSAGKNIGAPVSATDLDEDVLTYSLSGADAASFGIISTTGQLRTRAPLDYEQKNTYSVAVLVSDGNGGTDTIGVAINVTDVEENNAPVFVEGTATERSIPENTPAGRNIGAPVSATDLDEDVLTYSLSGADAASFGIVGTTGQLRTRAPLDYEKRNTYSVAVLVSDGNGGTDSIGVAINVTDVNENNDPVFIEGRGTERAIPENTPAGRNIGSPVSATDEDEDILTYTLSGVDAASFGIVSTTGQLRTRTPLDYEQKNTYSVAVLVSDGNGGTDSIGVAINVTDVNETPTAHAPVFVEGGATERAIAENTPAGRNIGSPVSATDEDEDILTYTLSGADAASFGIVSTTGQLRTRAPLDYEQKNTYSVAVIVSDGALTDSIGVAINVTDVAENNAPVFVEGSATERAIAENTPAGRNIGSPVSATDEDEDILTYTLSGADAASFGIVSTTGQLRTRAPLDYEQRNTYSVAVIVSDGALTDSIGVAINVTDVAENSAPVFASGSTKRSIPENTPAGVNIGAPVSATDEDGDTLAYSIDGTDASSFGIVGTTGQLKTSAPLDYEKKNAYSVTVIVSDGTLTDTISVGIKVTDVDENSAPVFRGSSTTRAIPENTPAGVNIGEAVSAKDTDGDDPLTYTLGGTDAASFDIDSTTGQLKTKAALDYETKRSYSVVVTASDRALKDTIRVTISITDVDESHAPAFAGNRTTRFVKENTPAGENVGSPVSATDEDDDTLTYTLGGTDASSFSIVRTTGQLKTRAALDFETKNAYTVTVTVSDGSRINSITVAITIIDVNEAPPTTDDSPRPGQIESVISISEIMFGSERRFTPSQWIELHNAGPDIINLAGWKLIIQNVDSPELTGPTTHNKPLVNVTITFKDDFWGDAPRLWPNDVVLVVSSSDSNSKNLTKDQIYDLRWRTDLPLGLWSIILSTEGFSIKLIDDTGNLVDEAGNLEGDALQWQLPYGQNRGRTRAGHRTSMIRRYADSVALDGTQAGGWISAVDANLTADQLTYYGDKTDISTPGIGLIINDISPQFVEYDVNQDGVVDISDLVLVAGRLGQSGPNIADVNGDGVVNVNDLILVAGAINEPQAAPSLHPASLEMFTAADVRGWLTQAHGLDLTDPKLQSGIRFLEQLLAVLVPKETELLHNYPNPFNPETWIPYRLAEDAFVTLTIYDQRGRVVRRLNVGHQTASVYESRSKAIYWDGRNEVGDRVASGIYFYTLIAGDYSATRKMLILK